MKEEIRKQIADMMGQMQCPKDFECAKCGFENLCKARDIGLEDYLECLEDSPSNCKFSLSWGYTMYLCHCPIRVYLSKKLKK